MFFKTLLFLLNCQIFLTTQDNSFSNYTSYLINATTSQIQTLSVPNNQTFALQFESNPTTGYNWYILNDISNSNTSLIKLDQNKGGQYQATSVADGIAGSGGYTYFLLKSSSNNSGNIEIDFVYKRIWENNDSDKTNIINIKVGNNTTSFYSTTSLYGVHHWFLISNAFLYFFVILLLLLF